MRKKFTLLVLSFLLTATSVFAAIELPMVDAQRQAKMTKSVNANLMLRSKANAQNAFLTPQPFATLDKASPLLSVKYQEQAISDNVEGLQIYNIHDNYDTWWSLNTATATSTALWSNDILAGYNFNAGFVRDGVVYAITGEAGYILKFDLATGEYLGYTSLGGEYTNWILHASYDKENDVVYVYTYNDAGDGLVFQHYDPSTNSFTAIKEERGQGTLAVDPIVTMAYNPLDKQVYAVTLYQERWISIDPATGLCSEIATLDFSPANYVQAMVYTPNNFSFTYVGIDVNDQTYQMVISPETGDIVSKTLMNDEPEYAILYCKDDIVAKGAPKAPQIESIIFENEATSGIMTIVMPTESVDQIALTDQLTLVVNIDGNEYATQTVSPGETVEIALNDMALGLHNAEVMCKTSDGIVGARARQNFYVGQDAPAAPQNVVLTETLISWDAVTTGENGGSLGDGVVTYNVYIDNEKINAEPITTTSYQLDLQTETLAHIYAEVEAVCNGLVSTRAKSNELPVGSYAIPLDLPITKDLLELIKIYDVNQDYSTWGWNDEHNAFEYTYSASNDGDDWAVFHKTYFPTSKQLYRIDVDVRSGYDFYPEKFEIGISKTGRIEDMEIVVPETIVASESIVTLGGQFKLEEAGDYFIGIHAISPADSYYLRLTRISVTMAEAPNSVPEACSDVVATAAEYGQLNANVEFTLPTKALSGDDLDPQSDVTVMLYSENVADTESQSVTATGKPGERLSAVVPTAQGVNIIVLQTSNENGNGAQNSVSLYTGVDIPKPAILTSLSVSADNRTMTFSWETSTEGVNGGFVDPAFCTYVILIYYPEQNYWFTQAGPGYDKTEYSYTVPEGTPLQTISMAVSTQNAAGYMEDGPMAIASLGVPYEIPMLETFEDLNVKYGPLTIEHPADEYSGSWNIVDPATYVSSASNDENASLVSYATENGETYSQLALPKFNPQSDESIKVDLRAYTYENMADAVVYVRGFDDQAYALGTISYTEGEEGWNTFSFILPEEISQWQWAEIVIRASFESTKQYLLIDKYEITQFSSVANLSVDSDPIVYATGSQIIVKNVAPQTMINVYTIDGANLVARKAQSSSEFIEINAGLYIVKCNEKTYKVVVK